MATAFRSVASSIPARAASPMRVGTSVSSSINPSVRMISIGPEGGKARVDTSFGNPFAKMRLINPSLNRGQIYGENGIVKSSKIDSLFGPPLNAFKSPEPKPRAGFTASLNTQLDITNTFARAKARNQELAAAKKVETIHNPEIFTQPERGRDRVLRNVNNPKSLLDLKRFQTIRGSKLPDQEGPVSKGFKRAEFKTLATPAEIQTNNPLVKSVRPVSRISIPELKTIIADFTIVSSRVEPNPASRQRFESVKWMDIYHKVETKIPKPAPEAKNQDANFQKIGNNESSASEMGTQKTDSRRPMSPAETALLTQEQRVTLITLAPLLRETDGQVRERVINTLGITKEAALAVTETLPKVGTPITVNPESKPRPDTQPELQPAQQAVKLINQYGGTELNPGEDEEALAKKAQALIAAIKQTYQLQGLAASDNQMQQLVERQLEASEVISPKVRSKFSLLLISLVKEVRIQQAAKPLNEPSTTTEGIHQVDLDKQNNRAKLAVKSITEAPRNEKGEIARDYIIEQFNNNNNENLWGGLALKLKQRFDGSLNELIIRLKKVGKWAEPKSLADTIDQTMSEFPAVEPSARQTTKLVGVKEVGKVMDPHLTELIKSIVISLVTVPQSSLQTAAA